MFGTYLHLVEKGNKPVTETKEETKVQAPPPPPISKIAEASLSASEMEIDPSEYFIKSFLAGPSGSGKTQSAITIPGRKLLVDCDNRAATIVGVKDLEVLPCYESDPRSPKAWTRLEAIRKQMVYEISSGAFPYQAVIFDGLTMMGRNSMNWALTLDPGRGLGGAPAQHHYLPQMDVVAKFVTSTLAFPLHIVYTGHIEIIEEKDTGRTLWLPKITGKLRTELANWFSETYFCYRNFDSEIKRTRYYWMTAGSGRKEFFKSSLNSLGRFWTDPIEIDFDKPRVGFADLLERRFRKRGDPPAKRLKVSS